MRPRDRTLFQEGEPPNPRFDLGTDAAIAYGVNATLGERVTAWRDRGYRVHLMTGLAWGHYGEYLGGVWDGREHWDEAQCASDGQPKLHGAAIPYMVPSPSYGEYLAGLLRQAIDAGVEAIFLEEPEFWASTGYGPAFEAAWRAHYGWEYRRPESDPRAFFQSAELKYVLYRNLIAHLCRAVRAYSGGTVPCYVATHSLLNYAHNRIVSPELSLRQIPECDGVILQVWGHTARSPVLYEGRIANGLFPVAFLEYGSGLDLVRGSERQIWYLADPVEDSPVHGWDRYRAGYEATVVASLLHPEVSAYEVMPWPSRVFTGRYPRPKDGQPGELIPQAYASEVLAVANALSRMPDGPLEWDSGTRGIGVLVADSVMFRRGGPEQDDPELSAFYGMAVPLVLAGMPVRPVSMEPLGALGVPQGISVLLLSYDGMTPPDPEAHQALADWVRAGHALILFGEGEGPYETLPAWWNGGAARGVVDREEGYETPRQGQGPWPDLYSRLGMAGAPGPGLHRIGKGIVLIEPVGPITLARDVQGGSLVRLRVQEALAALDPDAPAYREQSYLLLRRGQYVVATAPADAVHQIDQLPLHLAGRYVDLLDGNLPVREGAALQRGGHLLLVDLDRRTADGPAVVAASARIRKEEVEERTLRFHAAGPSGTVAMIRVALPTAPRAATANGAAIDSEWDRGSYTALLRHPNTPEGIVFVLEW